MKSFWATFMTFGDFFWSHWAQDSLEFMLTKFQNHEPYLAETVNLFTSIKCTFMLG